jgi:hypothetical protein
MGDVAFAVRSETWGSRAARGSSNGGQSMRRAQDAEPGSEPGLGQPRAPRGKRVEGWWDIADAVNRSPSWCQRAARPGRHHRLPVFYVGRQEGQRQGLPILFLEDLEQWLREAKR